jgi:N-formylglutamate deformylase
MTEQTRLTPIIFHIPHSSTHIPPEVRPSLIISDEELNAELLRMTDLHTDAIFGAAVKDGDAVIKFQVSRLVLDPERFVNDSEEPMSALGMGVVYTKRHDGTPLRADLDDKNRLVREYYVPHHAALSWAVDKQIEEFGRAFGIDDMGRGTSMATSPASTPWPSR